MGEPITVVVADDHDLVRRGIKTMLQAEDGIDVVGEAANGDEVFPLVEETLADVVLMDVVMPQTDGIEATRLLRQTWPGTSVVVLSSHDGDDYIFDALKAGASGYLLKTASLEDVVAMIRLVGEGGGLLDPTIATQMLKQFKSYQSTELSGVYQRLTQRETEILNHMAEGLPDKAIAAKLAISARTVGTHAANIYAKLHVNNRVSAIQEAVRRRLLRRAP
jgi:DNA-binding NarL/FixJ family response regulator